MSEKFCRRVGWGLLIGGLVILALTAATNYFRGDLLGVSTAGKWISSLGSVAIDIVGIVGCGLAAGACLAERRWGWGFFLSIALVLSVLWSANSILNYQAAERISASKTHQVAISRIKDADKLESDSAKKALDLAKGAGTRSARKDFIGANQDAIKSFRDAKVEVRVEPDAGPQWLASLIGWRIETILLTESTFFALLLIFLKSVCFASSGFFLSWSPEAIDRKLSGSPEGSGGKVKSEPEAVKQDEKVVAFPTPAKAEAVGFQAAPASNSDLPERVESQPKVSSATASVSAGAPSSSQKPKKSRKSKQDVFDFLRAQAGRLTHTSGAAIAKATGASEPTVSRALQEWEGKGNLRRERNGRSLQITDTRLSRPWKGGNGGVQSTFGH